MPNLPRGIAVYENVQAAQYEGPAILKLLKDTRLTGYAAFTYSATSANLLFDEGKLVNIVVESGKSRLTGFDALTALFDLLATEGGRLDVYRLSPALTRALLGFLRGTPLHEAQALKLIDRKALLENIRLQKMNGVLHIYTEDRSAMIFYKEGVPLGFFHDGTERIETSAAEFQNIAALPQAMVDVAKTVDVDDASLLDMLEMMNVEKIWQATLGRHAGRREALDREVAEKQRAAREATASSLESAVTEIATSYLGKIGRALVEKEIASRGGRSALLDPSVADGFLGAVEKGAKLLTSASKTKEMVDAIRGELAEKSRTTKIDIQI